MAPPRPLSPRQEALTSILQVRETYPGALISAATWDKVVSIAWDNRTHAGDRREFQRALRAILLAASRGEGADDATT